MATLNDIKLNSVYNFNTIAPNILEASFKNMRAVAILSYEEARKLEDLAVIHEQIKGTTNVILPIKVSDCSFVVFSDENKLTKVLAIQYLTNIEEVKLSKLIITINNYSDSDYSVLKNALEDLGYRNISFEVQSIEA